MIMFLLNLGIAMKKPSKLDMIAVIIGLILFISICFLLFPISSSKNFGDFIVIAFIIFVFVATAKIWVGNKLKRNNDNKSEK